eukprot:m51a1_g2847 hypothetical protein (417) ;mRNA; r:288681-290802
MPGRTTVLTAAVVCAANVALWLASVSYGPARCAPRPLPPPNASSALPSSPLLAASLLRAVPPYAGPAARVLFVCRHKLYAENMDRHFFFFRDAAARHPRVPQALLWGKGFEGYDDAKTLKQNIEAKLGTTDLARALDLVVVYEIETPKGPDKELLELSQVVPIAARLHECREGWCNDMIKNQNISIVLMAYPYEMAQYDALSARRVFAAAPNNAEPRVFYEPDLVSGRTVDIMAVGRATWRWYPLRKRLGLLVEKGTWKNAVWKRHPGWLVKKPEEQLKQYAADLKSSKIVLTCTSRFRYQVTKLPEIAMAGALIVSDVPLQDEELWSQVIVKVSVKDSDQKIKETVDWWLEHEEERLERVRRGQQLALQRYTADNTVDILLHALERWKRRRYGYWMPFPYSNTCVEASPSNKYCS